MQNNLGLCYLQLQQLDEAARCFQRAIAIDPQGFLPYSNLCLLMFNQHEYAKGIELGSKAVALTGTASVPRNQAMAHNNLAMCLWKSKRTSEALEHIKKAIAIDPANPLFQQNLQAIQGSSCFVITASMGDCCHPLVIELSAFRDHILARSKPGRCLIRYYYNVGPYLAQYIASSFALRRLAFVLVVIPALCIARCTLFILRATGQHLNVAVPPEVAITRR